MKHLKKHPVFTSLFILLIASFVAGVAYDVVLLTKNDESEKNEQRMRRRYDSAVQNDPGQQSLKTADVNIENLRERLNLLDKDLSRETTVLAPSPVKEGYALVERLRSMIGQWRMEAADKQVAIPENFDFSFKRYFEDNAKPPTDIAVPSIWRQASILNNILQKLYLSKPKDSAMSIISIQREVLPEETDMLRASEGQSTRRATRTMRSGSDSDTFEVPQYISARKKGSVSALGFKIVFTGYTEAMRQFLNQLNNYDLMLVVRSVEVKPFVGSGPKLALSAAGVDPMADQAALADAFASSAVATETSGETLVEGAEVSEASAEVLPVLEPEISAPAREPVVSENVSEFTFIIEYVEVDKTQVPAVQPNVETTEKAKDGE